MRTIGEFIWAERKLVAVILFLFGLDNVTSGLRYLLTFPLFYTQLPSTPFPILSAGQELIRLIMGIVLIALSRRVYSA